MTCTWTDAAGFALGGDLRTRAQSGLAALAGWASTNQVRHQWPRWSANAGRFPYHVHLPTDDTFLSTSWNTARMVQGLLGAWQVLRDPAILTTAERALEYVKSLQFFGPENPAVQGMFFAETPVSDHCPTRDGIECTQALVAHHLVTRDPVSLQRARAFCDCWVRRYDAGLRPKEDIMVVPRTAPMRFLTRGQDAQTIGEHWCDFAFALPLLQMAAITGVQRYTEVAALLGDGVLTHLLHADGSLRIPPSGHHTSTAEGFLDNDDGVLVALIALARTTGGRKWRDAAVANADWWLGRQRLPENHTSQLVLCMNLADLARLTGEPRFSEGLRANAAGVLARQILRDTRPLVQGAFRGEDMAVHYRAGSTPADFISLRSCSYGALALGRLACAGAGEWNPSYSAFGW